MHSLEGCQGPSTGEIFFLSSIWSLSSVSSPNFHQPHHKTDQPWLIKSNIVVIFITKHNTKPKTYSVICNDGTVESLLRILGLFLNDGLWVKAICWDCTSVYFNLQWFATPPMPTKSKWSTQEWISATTAESAPRAGTRASMCCFVRCCPNKDHPLLELSKKLYPGKYD